MFVSQDRKLKVDYDYNVNTARIAKEKGCQQFHIVSGAGVDSGKSNNFLKNKVLSRYLLGVL